MDDFNLVPSYVKPLVPEFNTIVSQAEAMNKNYLNISGKSVDKYQLIFLAMEHDDFWSLFLHVRAAKGRYASFWWNTVPSYLDIDTDSSGDSSGGDVRMKGHWLPESFDYDPIGPYLWRAKITFEKNVS